MNLSHYQPSDLEMDGRHGPKHCEAGREPLPADDQTAVLLLKPGKRPLGLEAGMSRLSGCPCGGVVFQTRLGIWARMPQVRSCWRSVWAS